MLCEFASGARGTFEASRSIIGPESQMAFEVYGTEGALGWNLEKLNELQLYLRRGRAAHAATATVFGGDRFPYHGQFVPGSANGIGFEDLVVIEDYEFCRAVAEGRAHAAGFARGGRVGQRPGGAAAVGGVRPLGGRRIAAGGLMEAATTATLRIGVHRRRPDRPHARRPARAPGAGATVAGVYDATPDSGAARRGSASRRGTRRRAARRADVDAVAICSPTDTHADLIVAAARAGKAIFCEKPISLDLAEVDRALAAVEAAGVPFQIGFNRRFDPAPRGGARRGRPRRRRRRRSSCASPAATPRRRRSTYVRDSGGIFLDMTIHDFDMARFVTGSEVVGGVRARRRARRSGVRRGGRRRHGGGHARARERLPDAIDNSRQAVYGYDQRVEVFGSRGHGGVGEPARAHARSCARPTARARARSRTSSSSATCRATCASGRRSSRAVAAGTPPPVAGRRRARAAGDRARGLAVAARGRAVRVDEIGLTDARARHRRRRLRRLAPRRARCDDVCCAGPRARSTSTDAAAVRRTHRRGSRPTRSSTPRSSTTSAGSSATAWAGYVGATRNVRRRRNGRSAGRARSRPTGCSTARRRWPTRPRRRTRSTTTACSRRRASSSARARAAPIARASPAVQGVTGEAPPRPGRRLRLLRRRARARAPRGRALHGLGGRRRSTWSRRRRSPPMPPTGCADRRRRPRRDLPLLRRRARRPPRAGAAHGRGVRARRDLLRLRAAAAPVVRGSRTTPASTRARPPPRSASSCRSLADQLARLEMTIEEVRA